MLVGIRQRVVRDERRDVAEFGGVRFEEFFTRGNAVEKIGDTNRRANRQTRGLYVNQFSAGKFDARAFGFRFVARFEQQPRDGGNCWQRFAAKTKRRDGKQIVGGFQFAGGVTLESQQRVVVNHAMAVVNDADHALAADFRFDANRLRSGIERVFGNSFTTEAGRSTTSPAAILFATASGNMRMRLTSLLSFDARRQMISIHCNSPKKQRAQASPANPRYSAVRCGSRSNANPVPKNKSSEITPNRISLFFLSCQARARSSNAAIAIFMRIIVPA